MHKADHMHGHARTAPRVKSPPPPHFLLAVSAPDCCIKPTICLQLSANCVWFNFHVLNQKYAQTLCNDLFPAPLFGINRKTRDFYTLQRSSSLLMYSGTVRFCQPGGVTRTFTRGVNELNGLTEIIYTGILKMG